MNVAVIMSAGSGIRFKGNVPKQFASLNNKPVINYSLEAFDSNKNISSIVVVANANHVKRTKDISSKFSKVVGVVVGGERRQDSVWNALSWIKKNVPRCKKVFIHDAVRPMINAALIDRLCYASKKSDAVIPAVSVEDTIKSVKKGAVSATIDRSTLVRVQTPQVFNFKKLYDAYKRFPKKELATDDGAIMEYFGTKVTVAEGDRNNLKITYPDDIKIAEAIINKVDKMNNIIIGTGYDSHKFKKGRRFVLGGVTIPYESGLDGHSDADALCHAVIDAILGASGKPDIGNLFPDTDAKWKNADSMLLLKQVAKGVKKDGVDITYIDSVVITEKPRLSPYVTEMRKKIAQSVGITVDRVNIKSKTNEGMGFIGNGEGLAVISNVTVERKFND